jgi:hypothetical protein
MMFWTRSAGIVDVVWSIGTVSPCSSCRELPGWQSTKYSPISDCWRTSQLASARKELKPGSVISASTTAQVRGGPA